jgi:hypothetical protein
MTAQHENIFCGSDPPESYDGMGSLNLSLTMTAADVTPSRSGLGPSYASGIPEIKFVAAAGQQNTIVKTSVGVSVSKTGRFFYSGGWGSDGVAVDLNFSATTNREDIQEPD